MIRVTGTALGIVLPICGIRMAVDTVTHAPDASLESFTLLAGVMVIASVAAGGTLLWRFLISGEE